MVGRPGFRGSALARQGIAFLLLACGLALAGCGRTQPSASAIPAPPWESRPGRVLEADLGLVRPGEKVRRRFSITNDSSSTWTLARLHNDCACTAGHPLTEIVLPGASLEVDVDYLARPSNLDDHRRVGVEFVEPAAPFVWLEIRACIRAPISIFPARPTIVPARHGDRESSFEIHNYTDQDVHRLSVRSLTPWLTPRSPEPIASSNRPGARQVWRVVVEAKTDGLPVGCHHAQIAIQTDCPEASETPVLLDLDLRGPVQASPDELAFGVLSAGGSARRKVFLRYAPDGARSELPRVSLTHDLGEQLQVSYAALSATAGEVSAVLTPSEKGAGGELKGRVVIDFGGNTWLPLELPVSATIR
jgi:hypothetical protein